MSGADKIGGTKRVPTVNPNTGKARNVMSQAASENPIAAIAASYRQPIIRAYSMLRFTILRQVFLDEIGQYLPDKGRILDIGCGFGLFTLYFASTQPGRTMYGIDSNARRIDLARESAKRLGLDNAHYESEDARDWSTEESFDAVYLLDLIHHLPRAEVSGFLERVRDALRPGGLLLVKDIEDRPRWKMWFTLILDRLMVGGEDIHYWPEPELSALLRSLGFDVKHHRMRDFLPYPHILYVCRLPQDDDHETRA